MTDYDSQHTFDVLSNCCTKCGAYEWQVSDQACPGGGNVTAITHLTVRNRNLKHRSDVLLAAVEEAP